MSDSLQLGDGVIGDRARDGGETVRAGLEGLDRDEPQVADREDRTAHVVLRAGRERDQEDDERRTDRHTRRGEA